MFASSEAIDCVSSTAHVEELFAGQPPETPKTIVPSETIVPAESQPIRAESQPVSSPPSSTPPVTAEDVVPELSATAGSPPTLPVETFGGVSIFNPATTEESTEESTETGWEKEFEDWNIDDVDKTDFEDIQL